MLSVDVTQVAPSSTHRASLTVAHIAAVLFGLTGIFGALINADATVITYGRAAFAVLALLVFAHVQRRPLFRGLSWRKLAILFLSGAMLTAHWVTFFIAIKVGGVAMATLGFASFPAFIALLDLLVFRERIGAREAVLLALVSTGLVLVAPSFDLGDQGTIGLLWGLASGLSFAMLAMTNRRATRGMDAMQVAFWQNVTVALLISPFSLEGFVNDGLATADWIHLGLLGVFCTGLSQYLFVKSLDGLDARSAGMIIALEPVYAIACAWWLFGERPSLLMVAGAALIIVATVLSARSKSSEPSPST
ncbi:DMT family transporter [Pseudomonas sp. BN102]|uniref:DMT family transporter n=1 Tax=Pseudomonas sp. BN102 TaxID=2567886 RepID=UPI002453CA9A|nr:DMT family transporter [Pseudomonas sp. BN102]MDH4608983.1 DMT family transporter [Pseudomonas sp. BN102]